ncbi:MAG: hypothetical protein J6T72_04935 [Alphaproteobacteria bacterium]|nr:hypothetical protein [Alphaproteobacteria bacterium]
MKVKDKTKEKNVVAISGVHIGIGGTIRRIADRAKKFIKDYSATVKVATVTALAAVGAFTSSALATNSEDAKNRAAAGGVVTTLGSGIALAFSSFEREQRNKNNNNNNNTAKYTDFMER